MIFSVITLFPSFFNGFLSESMMKIAQDNKSIEVRLVDLRSFGTGKHKTVDDKPYGGGRGMILKVDVLSKAIQKTKIKNLKNEIVILLDPRGKRYIQSDAEKLTHYDHIILIAGHYEGYDERIRNYIDAEISIGDFIVTGGEIPAMAIIDSVTRLIKGAILDEDVVANESFSKNFLDQITLEYPQYTRPELFEKHHVPKVLLSGNHKDIEEYRQKMAKKITLEKRPDLFKS